MSIEKKPGTPEELVTPQTPQQPKAQAISLRQIMQASLTYAVQTNDVVRSGELAIALSDPNRQAMLDGLGINLPINENAQTP